ncbi:MAG TPA: sortase [Patescibacteria group bacterium]|jgi:LPXTG-site transpeptidase (sortase) family protein|nr:sortase [Patescibacteria group bacterium]
MHKLKLKIALGVIGFFLLLILSYIAMNTSYFFKQVNFYFHPPKVDTAQQNSNQDKGQPNHLSIPSLGIEAPIIEPSGNTEANFQEALKNGPVHYPGTAGVGQVGNMYIFGHSSDFAFKAGNYKTVFALLPSIQNGAEIVLTDGSGRKFVYKVFDHFVAASTDVKLLSQDTQGKKILTLQTSYPVGTALKRYIAKAELQ